MLESFKINCYPLNRTIRITIRLPKDYNNTARYYPVLYVFDGQSVFLKDHLNLETIIEQIEKEHKEAIFVGIAAAQDTNKRENEYNHTALADFILNELHSYLLTRYRMNDYIYAIGCAQAALNAFWLATSDLFKGAIILSPRGDETAFKAVPLHNDKPQLLYFSSQQEDKEILEILKWKCSNASVTLLSSEKDDIELWKEQMLTGLQYLIF